jgi:hypothetical protein
MNAIIQTPVHRGLSDALQAAIDTGNIVEARCVMWAAGDARADGQLSEDQFRDLQQDYFDFTA